jgi:hypothetical protein
VKANHELKQRGGSNEKAPDMPVVKLILVPHYAISMTTSGKGRRSACVEHCRQDALERLDVSV